MFNHSMDKARASDFSNNNNDDPFGFGDQGWTKFGFSNSAATAGHSQPQPIHGHAPRQSFGSSSAMDWAPTPSDMDHHTDFHHGADMGGNMDIGVGESVEIDNMSGERVGGGVNSLIARFEKQSYVPPLPPRPIQNAPSQSHIGTSPTTSSQFGSLNAAAAANAHRVASPMNSPDDSYFGSFGAHSRVASPMGASPPIMNFGSFHDNSRVSSPMGGPSSEPFGSLDDFMAVNRVHSPMVPTPMAPSPMVHSPMTPNAMAGPSSQAPAPTSGTPGFAIWRAPPSMTNQTPQPQSQAQPQFHHQPQQDFQSSFQHQPQPQAQSSFQHHQPQSQAQSPFQHHQPRQQPQSPFQHQPQQQPQSPFQHQSHQTPQSPFQLQPQTQFQPPPQPQPQQQEEQPPPKPPRPSQARNRANSQISSGGFFKPPVPPKPAMSAGNQFILELNPSSKAKGKAPAKPPRPRVPIPPPPTFTPELKQEPMTPQPLDALPASSATPAHSEASDSLRNQTGTRPSREQVPAESWEQYKTTIKTLYLEERKPLKEVMSVMADQYGFQATPKMYKTRFSQWGFVKNNTEDEVKRLLSMKFQRDAEGKVSEFVRNGKVVNLGTYLKRKGVTEYDLVDFELPADLPSHIRCRTPTPPPTPGYLRSPDLLRAQELLVGNMRKAFLHCRQLEVEGDIQVGWPSTMVWGAGSSDLLLEANFYFEAQDADQGGHFLMQAFKQLEVDLKQLSPQGINELLLGMVNRDLGMIMTLCKYLAAYSSTNLERSDPLRQIFTCLYEVQQKHGSATLSELLWGSIPTIAEELEAIYGRRHPYIARTWIDLALFYNHVNPERLEKLVPELRAVQRQIEQQHGSSSVDALTIRYAIVQLLYLISPQSDVTKRAANELWSEMRSMNLVSAVRDTRANSYCYHSPNKVDITWAKRCRRRYDSGMAILEELVGVKVHAYFEEDFHILEHMPEHVPDAQESWAAALQQMPSKWGFI